MEPHQLAKKEIRCVLERLQTPELLNLACTSTQGMLRNVLDTREEAIDAIVAYSDPLDVLRRRAVTREVLFYYLHERKVPMKPPLSKSELVELIASYWNKDVVATPTPQPTNDVQTMALKFADWFYDLMNRTEPIGTEHFWNDSAIRVRTTTYEAASENDPNELVGLLFKVKSELHFNPNVSDQGVVGRMDPHGIVGVWTCGTVHSRQRAECVGVFDQVFVLARDPFVENNWKVKRTELNVRSRRGGVGSPPSLHELGVEP